MRKTIGIVQGDPAGVGPELLARLLNETTVRDAANIVVIGDPDVFASGEARAGTPVEGIAHSTDFAGFDHQGDGPGGLAHLDVAIDDLAAVPIAESTAVGGQASMNNLRTAFELARDELIDGICFLPFNKESMHKGGNPYSDELGFAKDFFQLQTRASEFNVIDGMWNGRVTSHVALRDVADLITIDNITEAIELADQTLKRAGFKRPRIVVAALNPHAGEGGLMGDEEITKIRPAVERAKLKQIAVAGPLPSDTLWLKVKDGTYDAVITMYHDQGQIAIKLMGFDRGVSVLAGLPVPVTTPAHGTAFDIVGQNKANLTPALNAFAMVVAMAERKNLAENQNAA